MRISIHAAREGGDYAFVTVFRFTDISIHAAREGGDPQRQYQTPRQARISIHAAREGGDQPLLTTLSQSLTFQSTPPVKAATPL